MYFSVYFSPEDVDGLFKFMTDNFNVQYKGNRAPFGFYIHAAWFALNENNFLAYKKFIDYVLTLKDAYIVSTTPCIVSKEDTRQKKLIICRVNKYIVRLIILIVTTNICLLKTRNNYIRAISESK